MLGRWLGVSPDAGGPAAAPEQAAVDALIDEARMRTFRDDYPDIVDQLLDLFLQSTPPLLDELRAAVHGDDQEVLRRTAHKLKGSCQNIGATFMATLCSRWRPATATPARAWPSFSTARSRRPSRRSAPCSADVAPGERQPRH